jgi:hypothetical protein
LVFGQTKFKRTANHDKLGVIKRSANSQKRQKFFPTKLQHTNFHRTKNNEKETYKILWPNLFWPAERFVHRNDLKEFGLDKIVEKLHKKQIPLIL